MCRAYSRCFVIIHDEHFTLLLAKHHCVDSTNLCIRYLASYRVVLWLIALLCFQCYKLNNNNNKTKRTSHTHRVIAIVRFFLIFF